MIKIYLRNKYGVGGSEQKEEHRKGAGGGEGKAPVGRAGPVTPWGKAALGLKTRKKNKPSNKYVLRKRRKVSKRSRGGRDS